MTRTQAIAPRILLFGLCLWWGLAASAQAAGRDMAVLVVGRSTDATMAAQERQIIDKLNQGRNQRGWNPRTLPIYSYHFDKDGERLYCEQRLKVKATDLVVVGLVELEGGVPVNFVYRESNVRSAERCADMVMERAKVELANRGVTVATRPSTTPRPPVTASPSAHPTTRPVVVVSPKPPVAPAGSPTVRPVASTSPTTRPVVTVTPTTRPVVITSPSPRPVVTTTPRPVVVTPSPRPVTTSTPVAVQTPGPTQTVTPNPNDRWAIQVGLVSTLEQARTLARKMKDDGHKRVEIRKMWKEGKVMFRVLIGFFSVQAEAYAKVKEMREAGLDCFSVRIDAALGQVVH